MVRQDFFTRRRFLVSGAAGAAALAARAESLAQTPAQTQKFHVKPVSREIFIDHGINQETRLETLRGYLTPGSHFFIRQHATTPSLDLGAWRLRVEGNAVEHPVELSFDDLLRLPSSNPFAERLIGSIRRECLNHVLVINERHLHRILTRYVGYYHQARTHLALDKDAPDVRPIALPTAGSIVQLPEVGGLHHRYIRQAA